MRPKKTRWVNCSSEERIFTPQTKSKQVIVLSLDEFEALRLLDKEGLSQTEAAKLMKVHRSTISRIASVARQKVAQALVENSILKIEGGCCQMSAEGKCL